MSRKKEGRMEGRKEGSKEGKCKSFRRKIALKPK